MSTRRIRRVAVVGGGPAGATCASRLARSGRAVDLFEARPSGEKPCGGAIPGAALGEFPVLRNPALPRRVVDRVVLHSPAGRRVEVRPSEGIHVYSRRELDPFLRERARQAGASVIETTVRRIRRADDGTWTLTTDAGVRSGYDFLVGADGVRGLVRRTLAGRPPSSTLTLARYAYVSRVPAGDLERMTLKFFSGSDGYLWVFPRKDHLSIGICAGRDNATAGSLEEDLDAFMRDHYPEAARQGAPVKGYFIPADPEPPSAANGDCWALIGDAGGFVDPVTREGIAPAMRSAVALADRLLGGSLSPAGEMNAQSGSPRWLASMDAVRAGALEIRSLTTPPLPPNLRLAHAYKQGFFQEDFVERMIRMAAGSRAIRRVLGDLFGGLQGYRGLKRRLVLNALPCGLEMGLAALRGRRETPSGSRPEA